MQNVRSALLFLSDEPERQTASDKSESHESEDDDKCVVGRGFLLGIGGSRSSGRGGGGGSDAG